MMEKNFLQNGEFPTVKLLYLLLFRLQNPQAAIDIFIWRKEGHGLTVDDAVWGTPICLTGDRGTPGQPGEKDRADRGETGKTFY